MRPVSNISVAHSSVQSSVIRAISLQTEGESNPLKFSQMFHLAAQGSSFVITNGAPVTETLLLIS